MSKNKEIAVKEEATVPALTNTTDWMSGAGLDEFEQSDFKLPYLSMLQAMSPQTKPREPDYIAGAVEGKIMHSLTKELYDSVRVLPCRVQKRFQTWEIDQKGKPTQMIKELTLQEATAIKPYVKNVAGKNFLSDGSLLVEKWQWYVIVFPEDSVPYRACLTMKASQLKNSKLWVSLLMADGGFPKYLYKLSAKGENYEDNSWVGWDPKHLRDAEGKKLMAPEEDIAQGLIFQKDVAAMKFKLTEEPEINVSSETQVM